MREERRTELLSTLVRTRPGPQVVVMPTPDQVIVTPPPRHAANPARAVPQPAPQPDPEPFDHEGYLRMGEALEKILMFVKAKQFRWGSSKTAVASAEVLTLVRQGLDIDPDGSEDDA